MFTYVIAFLLNDNVIDIINAIIKYTHQELIFYNIYINKK